MSITLRILSIAFLLIIHTANVLGNDWTWVPFESGTPASEPQITLLESNDSYVRYLLVTGGMWVTDVTGTDEETYQILNLKKERNETEVGYPMLPRVPVNIAVPEGSTVDVSVTVTSQLTLSGYKVAPFPEVTYNCYGEAEYSYTPDEVIYALTSTYPENQWCSRSHGHFRAQEIDGHDVYSIRCKPALEELVIADTLEVLVEFSGGVGPALQDLGIFTDIGNSSCLNYDIPPRIFIPSYSWSVTFIDDKDTWLNNPELYPCDYLIVIPDENWYNGEGAHDQPNFITYVEDFAEMRAKLSGFDICIVEYGTADGSINPDIDWNEYGDWYEDATFMNIRNFVKAIYENGVANNTGKLGFLLLIGDARDDNLVVNPDQNIDAHDWLIPSPRPFPIWHEARYAWYGRNGSDSWYGCLDGIRPVMGPDEDEFDYIDIAVGRFPIGCEEEMSIVLSKFQRYCLGTDDRSYRWNILGISGREHDSQNDTNGLRLSANLQFREIFEDWENTGTRYYAYGYQHLFGDDRDIPYDDVYQLAFSGGNDVENDIIYINSKIEAGVGVLAYTGHGFCNVRLYYGYYTPEERFVEGDYLRVENSGELHLVVAHACATNMIDPWSGEFPFIGSDYDACSEISLVKSLNGAIGYIGGCRDVLLFGNHENLNPLILQKLRFG